MSLWEEIRGFASPGEFDRFVEWLTGQLAAGLAEEIQPDPDYGPGEIYGGRWIREVASGETWRLVPPDPPFRGLWEPVRL